MTRVLVVGGAGFLGSHLVPELLQNGYEVTVQDQVPSDSAAKLKPFLKDITYSWKSIVDFSVEDLAGIDALVHLAGQADVPFALKSPRQTWDLNTNLVVDILEAVKKKPLKTIIMSTDNVYGKVPAERLPIREEEPVKPTNIYGASKAAMEVMAQTYARKDNIPIMILRSASIFGEGSRPQVIPIFIRQALEGKDITIEGDGSQSRDFNYVRNTAHGIVCALRKDPAQFPVRDKVPHNTWNIASGEETTIKNLAETIIRLTGSKSKVVNKPWREGEQGIRYPLSIEKASLELGYRPKHTFEEGLGRTVEHLKSKA